MSETLVLPVPAGAAGRAALTRATLLLRAGQVVAFPTETVYGLGADALDPQAVGRIYEAKGRPPWNPLIVHVADAEAARRLVSAWPEPAERLAARYWPGPLTIVLPRAAVIPDIVTAGRGTVALRVPGHPVALALLQSVGGPLAAPSANRSGEVSPTTAAHVVESLGGRIPLVLDGGPTEVGIESTVVDLSGDRPVLLRPGMVPRTDLEAIIGPVALPMTDLAAGSPRASPGMLERHYAPRAPFALFRTGTDPEAVPVVALARATGGRVAALVLRDRPAMDVVVAMPERPADYARDLYATLRRLDAAGVACIIAESPPALPEWDAIRDRLHRAAHP